MRSLSEIVRDNGGDNTPMLDTHNLTGRVRESLTLDNGQERDVNPDTDYRCDECSTKTLDVFHVKVDSFYPTGEDW